MDEQQRQQLQMFEFLPEDSDGVNYALRSAAKHISLFVEENGMEDDDMETVVGYFLANMKHFVAKLDMNWDELNRKADDYCLADEQYEELVAEEND